MADAPDKPDTPLDDNEALVNALESIKSLLATSETKLNQARESISQASAQSLKITREVPVLEDVVVPGKPPQPSKAPPEPPAPATSEDTLKAFQAQLEADMQVRLLAFTAQLEQELKQKIKEFIRQHTKPTS